MGAHNEISGRRGGVLKSLIFYRRGPRLRPGHSRRKPYRPKPTSGTNQKENLKLTKIDGDLGDKRGEKGGVLRAQRAHEER